ncbi:NACHT domain-containing protein [Pandoraea sp. NPDC090278]|uniref:NACHT domain-containing protein n=1 Tax=Pandoraea sp. NPDC090278 TaxID=3364391 RepID=UPI00383A3392
MGKKAKAVTEIDTVRASRAGHTFHERWTARRALQLVFPNDDLFAIAVEGISSTETVDPGVKAEEVADLVLYYGSGDNFRSCDRLETIQFKYKIREEAVTAAYLKKTVEKFSSSILGYEGNSAPDEVDKKISFVFVTNAEFTESLWEAIRSLVEGTTPSDREAANQAQNLKKWCKDSGLSDSMRLFSRTVFQAGEKRVAGLDNALKRTLTDWSAGADSEARIRLHELQDLVLKKASPSGQGKNLIRREDVLDALDCEPEDLFPADTRFIDVGAVVERAELSVVSGLIETSEIPVVVHADGGVGKTVLIQSLAEKMASEFEVVVFDCFGGGSYRSENHSRHLPRIGLVQIVNELASRTLCDPMLPGGDDNRKIMKAARRRLEQAALAIRTQSKKQALLIIIDAADNAQLEADYRHEAAFPRLLLSTVDEDPIEGVKLLFTARPHRKGAVIGSARVNELALGPFTDSEACEFLKERKPSASYAEITTALARSGRNARVLDYLVQTWDTNVIGTTSDLPISVREIIAQRCTKIVSDLHIAGWPDSEITEFFVALSLLPPPIPLEELANALGWSAAQVKSAASDLAPMLEITSHGAIFRDEPTETYVRETYSDRSLAQKSIADRLLSSQATSTYAAEALPHFLVVIKDSDRAFALADSTSFPASVQSDFGRRRLALARLRAAFRLAVAEDDFDRALELSMRLSQSAAANMRGDEFIRSSPALAIVLGDADSYRRLASDRSGWRGARSARLTVAHQFAGDAEEAQIQCESTIRWINWNASQRRDGFRRDQSGPEMEDYVAVLFQQSVQGRFESVNRNLARRNERFSLSACYELLRLLELFDQANETTVLKDLTSFAVSNNCDTRSLRLWMLARCRYVDGKNAKVLAQKIAKFPPDEDRTNEGFSTENEQESANPTELAALAALFYGSRTSAAAIIGNASRARPSAYDYGERYGLSRAWPPILRACIRAWSAKRPVAYHDLLPDGVKVTKLAKSITTGAELATFLQKLRKTSSTGNSKKRGKKQLEARFDERVCRDISHGIDVARALTKPIEDAVLNGRFVSVSDFLDVWEKLLRRDVHWRTDSAADSLVRTLGLGCMGVLLNHAREVSVAQAEVLIGLISTGHFFVPQKIDVLGQLARRPALHELAGKFARHVAEQIRRDDDVGGRGASYIKLAESLVHMSINEAREYYREGLAELDQIGGESYDQIYALLHFSCAQQGGFLKPALAQRLMNLCQTLVQYDARKFGWTLFARAAATSIGLPAIAKLVRWHDQDVADLSYGLPQLVCFLAKNGKLDPRRAAFVLTICEEHGWWDWRTADGVADLLGLTDAGNQRRIFLAIFEKWRGEYPSGGWPALWEGLLEASNKYPSVTTTEVREEIERLCAVARRNQEESRSRSNSSSDFLASKSSKRSEAEVESVIAALASACDPTSESSIDEHLRTIASDDKLSYSARQQFINKLRVTCPYSKRLPFLSAICSASELSFAQSLEILSGCFTAWIDSSKHLVSEAKVLVVRLFECKSPELFEGQFSDVTRDIRRLSDLCNDQRFVLQLVLRKVAADEVDLDGNEWLQLATALCEVADAKTGLCALESLLSGPAARIADEIGEGPFRQHQEISTSDSAFIVDVIWHLLGDDDAYVRWTVSRGLKTLVELGLNEDLSLLVDRFDQTESPTLASTDRKLSFQNSQQWLLMGLARVALHHGETMGTLRNKLRALAQRPDLHVINKVHLARCLSHIGGEEPHDEELGALLREINQPAYGVAISDDYPGEVTRTSDIRFDYEFTKNEIGGLARIFNVSTGTIEDAIATEIKRKWPKTTSMNDFPGSRRHWRDQGERYESYREHIQRHALLSVATNLLRTMPTVVRSYEDQDNSPWLEWRDRFDVTFDDGSWLSDHKDAVPQQAKEYLLGQRVAKQETLQDQDVILRKLGFCGANTDALFPLYGTWSSPDGVSVRFTSALTARKDVAGRCRAFAKRKEHDFWLPEFWDDGYYDRRYRKDNPFAPFVWAPEAHRLGIDEGDEMAAKGPARRPRLGIDITKSLSLLNEPGSPEWRARDGRLALRSQVWGNWKPDSSDHRSRYQDDGEMLWASPGWLDATLSDLDRNLVFTVKLCKYGSSRDYDPSEGVKSVFLGLRADDGTLEFWPATNASKQD